MPKKIKFEVFMEEYQEASELPKDSQTLIEQARDICNHAHAPFSNFKVGAAVLLENGAIVNGTNQENIAFPSGLCAERVALFAAATKFPGVQVCKIAITATKHSPTTYHAVRPCGGCLQVMTDYQARQNAPIEVLMEGTGGAIQVASSVDMLLPFKFSSNLID